MAQGQWVQFWWRSGLTSGSMSPKSEIRIYWIIELPTDFFYEIIRRAGVWLTNWLHFGDDPHHYPDPRVRSGSRSGSGKNCHNSIMLAFGGGLCSLSTSSFGYFSSIKDSIAALNINPRKGVMQNLHRLQGPSVNPLITAFSTLPRCCSSERNFPARFLTSSCMDLTRLSIVDSRSAMVLPGCAADTRARWSTMEVDLGTLFLSPGPWGFTGGGPQDTCDDGREGTFSESIVTVVWSSRLTLPSFDFIEADD